MEQLERTTRWVDPRRADIMTCARDAVEHPAEVGYDADAILISSAGQSPR